MCRNDGIYDTDIYRRCNLTGASENVKNAFFKEKKNLKGAMGPEEDAKKDGMEKNGWRRKRIEKGRMMLWIEKNEWKKTASGA